MKRSWWAAATSLVAVAVLSAGMIVVASVAAAVPAAAPKATGGVALVDTAPFGPQYVSFSAITGSPAKGSVAYTNFGLPQVGSGSGVWNLSHSVDFVFMFDAYGERDHTMTLTSVTALSTKKIAFTGTGYNNGYQGTYDWSAQGTVDSSVDPAAFSMDLLYTSQLAGMGAHIEGVIADDGSISGSFTSDWGPGTWSAASESVFEVFSYTAQVTCASVSASATPPEATFGFTIPSDPNFPGLSGLNVVAHVTDNGSPGVGNDTWSHGLDNGPGACTGAYGPYGITSGNIVVH